MYFHVAQRVSFSEVARLAVRGGHVHHRASPKQSGEAAERG